jgi:hypothetical protein
MSQITTKINQLFNVSESEYKPALQPEAVLTVIVVAENQRAVIVESGVEILGLDYAPGNPLGKLDVNASAYSHGEGIS